MILGVTGFIGSGKDTLAKYLERKGFVHYSLSDEIREEAKKRGLELTRENLVKLGNEIREKEGDGALARRVKSRIERDKEKNYVITSIRTLGEINELRLLDNFFLIFIDAPPEERYKRVIKRNREDIPQSFEEFLKRESRELAGGEGKQNLILCKSEADVILINDTTIEKFYGKIDELLRELEEDINLRRGNIRERLSKEEYYLRIAEQVAERSTCLSVKIGAVIVRDDQIVSTGYVGAPRKTLSSLERGFCLRRKLRIPSGQRYELCRSVHAEQNAIINAARAGVSILNGTMYIFGKKIYKNEEKLITAYPCFICKKMIINAGLKEVVIRNKDGGIDIYKVEDWIKEWQERDMLDDLVKYDAGIYEKKIIK